MSMFSSIPPDYGLTNTVDPKSERYEDEAKTQNALAMLLQLQQQALAIDNINIGDSDNENDNVVRGFEVIYDADADNDADDATIAAMLEGELMPVPRCSCCVVVLRYWIISSVCSLSVHAHAITNDRRFKHDRCSTDIPCD